MTMYERKYEFTITDLMDQMTIDQIKEVLLPPSGREGYAQSLAFLSSDVSALFGEGDLKLTGRVLRLITLIAQLNLETWRSKDKLDEEPQSYTATVRHAQDLNGLRNCARNLLQSELGEASPARRRATFFVTKEGVNLRQRIVGTMTNDTSTGCLPAGA
jgi:hypothetical protein